MIELMRFIPSACRASNVPIWYKKTGVPAAGSPWQINILVKH